MNTMKKMKLSPGLTVISILLFSLLTSCTTTEKQYQADSKNLRNCLSPLLWEGSKEYQKQLDMPQNRQDKMYQRKLEMPRAKEPTWPRRQADIPHNSQR